MLQYLLVNLKRMEMEFKSQLGNGVNLKNSISLIMLATLILVGCKKDDNGKIPDEDSTPVENTNLAKAINALGYAAFVSDQYNNQGLKPSSVTLSGTTASVYYTPNGALGSVSVSGYAAHFYNDVGRRPFAILDASIPYENAGKAFYIMNGTYDYEKDSVKVIAYIGSWTGSSVFTSLSNLKLMSNNDAITEQIYNSISFSNNCYKMIVFDKDKTGKLIGKYVGYSTNGKTYIYWCIDPESSSFGEKASKNTPYS
jgi:hypothetical protein